MTRSTINAVPRMTGRLRQALGRMLLHGSVAGLTVFHAALLWERIADLTLLEPAVALRWAAAGLLLVSLVLLRQAGVPLLRGRQAMIVWTLVAVLHACIAPVNGAWAVPLAEVEAGLWLALPLALSAALALAGGPSSLASSLPSRASRRHFGPPTRHFLRAAYLEILSPRPPPAI